MRRHMRIDVRGALRRSDRELRAHWEGAITDDSGRVLMSGRDVREFFMDQLAAGHEFIPLGDCPTFDYVAGCCPGHDDAPSEATP